MTTLKNNIAEISISYRPKTTNQPQITSSEDAREHLHPFFPDENIALYERFIVGYLNRANKLIGVYEVSKGGMTSTVVDIRLILSVALKSAATGIILAHNHPSGNLQPSDADKKMTERINEACQLMDIKLLDHLIFSPSGAILSFASEGLL
jgi:DNA repair protein RadC